MFYVANQQKICIEVIYSQGRSCKNLKTDDVLPMFFWLWFYYVVFVS